MCTVILHKSSGRTSRPGIALLMVLLIVMAITIVSVGFLARADAELGCGENMALRLQMDQLADSGIEHARGLLLHPQDVPADYWTGAPAQQLMADGPDYYDVNVTRDASDPTDYCTYIISCEAYRVKDNHKTGRSGLRAQLRLDPCIALWTGADLVHRAAWSCSGDVYCAGALTNLGVIDGDVFAGALTGAVTGQCAEPNQLSLAWPPVTVADFTSRYGTDPILSGSLAGTVRGPYDPPRVCYRNGDLLLDGNVTINGMLLVNGNLTIRGTGNVITGAKNLPALYVTQNLILHQAAGWQIQGLAVVGGSALIGADTANSSVRGGLFVAQRIVETALDASANRNDAVLVRQPLWRPAAGRDGGALEFDGVDDYLQTLDSSTALQLVNDYTLSVWVKPADVQKPWAGILCKTDVVGTPAPTNHWTLQFGAYGTKLFIYHPDKSWDTAVTLSDLLAGGSWHHLAIVRQGTAMTSYVDGSVRKSEADARDPLGYPVNPPGAGNGHLNIAAERTATGDCVYKGLMDDVRVYNVALSQAEIAALASMTSVAALPVGHWKLDESGSALTITAQPTKAAIIVWSAGGAEEHWGPAAGSFIRSMQRE
jgi:hypothetical protein